MTAKGRELANSKAILHDPAEIMALAMQAWHMASVLSMPGSASRLLVEGIRWSEEAKDGKEDGEAARRFRTVARLFLEDNLIKVKQQGGYMNPYVVEALEIITGIRAGELRL